MRVANVLTSLGLCVSLACGLAFGQDALDPNQPDFATQGEYMGEVQGKDGPVNVGVQVIALGKGKFAAVGYRGGLPGDGWDGEKKEQSEGEARDGVVVFQSDEGSGTLKDGVLTIRSSGGVEVGALKKVVRQSPTLGAKPPKGAVVLFDGASADNFPGAKMSDDGLLMQGATSKQKFQSFTAHIEFLLPFMPEARGQGRGNSGVYFQGRYEVQMLDSFGLKGENNECGGIYEIAAPRVNMCYPPLSWQTYDVDFTAAVYEGEKKVKNATLTVRHNGVPVHENVELPRATRAAPVKESSEPGPIYLQNHGNPVRYRNIWVLEKK